MVKPMLDLISFLKKDRDHRRLDASEHKLRESSCLPFWFKTVRTGLWQRGE